MHQRHTALAISIGLMVPVTLMASSPALAKADPSFEYRTFLADGHFESGRCVLNSNPRLYVGYDINIGKPEANDLSGEDLLLQARVGPGRPWRTTRRYSVDAEWVRGYKSSTGFLSDQYTVRGFSRNYLNRHRFRFLIPASAWTERAATSGMKAGPYCG